MKFYSTKNINLRVGLKEAVLQGQAADGGLYLPEFIPELPEHFFSQLERHSFHEIGFEVANAYLKDDVPCEKIKQIIQHTIDFDVPLVEVESGVYSLELFHGPTMAFKDFGARFMSQLLGYFASNQQKKITILAATSGDTGSAVANGFLGVKGVQVIVLYPSGKVSEIQEKQFTTLGQNIAAVEIDGTFDDCQQLVKQAFSDEALNNRYFLTSANSINIARLIPQSFYYFYAFSKLKKLGKPVVFSVPSGNFGNLTAGLIAKRMGLPVQHFVACTNINDIVPQYLRTGFFEPRKSVQTISNAMDVGNPSNFSRLLELFKDDLTELKEQVSGYSFSDTETEAAISKLFSRYGYLMDPHGAIGYLGLKKYMQTNENLSGVFLETAHPAKFRGVVEEVIQQPIQVPETLQHFMLKEKQSIQCKSDYKSFQNLLLDLL